MTVDTVVLALGLRPDCDQGGEEEQAWEVSRVGDRPWIQHILENLIAQGQKEILWILHHQPQEVEDLLGDGSRWGARFHYRLARQPDKPFQCLRGLEWLQPVWLGSALDFPPQLSAEAKDSSTWQRVTPDSLAGLFHSEWKLTTPPGAYHLRSSLALLEMNEAFLDGKLPVLQKGREVEPGIWLERGVVLHPTVQLIAPVFLARNCRIGPGCRLGPKVVVGPHCLIEERCELSHCVLQRNTFLGAGLELQRMLVSPGSIRLADDGELLPIVDTSLVGRSQPGLGRAWQAPLARLLAFLGKPLAKPFPSPGQRFVLKGGTDHPSSWNEEELPAPIQDLLKPRQHFRQVFLPGLKKVLEGRLDLVGLTPQDRHQLQRLPLDARRRYLSRGPGLVGESLVQFGPQAPPYQSQLGDAYQLARQGPAYELGLLVRYFLDVAINRPYDLVRLEPS